MAQRDLDKLRDNGVANLREWYYSEIRSIALEAIKVAEGEAREEWLHETIDGHQFVIYTFQAKCALLASDNESEWRDVYTDSDCPTDEQKCYFAMRADVQELLNNEHWVSEYQEQRAVNHE